MTNLKHQDFLTTAATGTLDAQQLGVGPEVVAMTQQLVLDAASYPRIDMAGVLAIGCVDDRRDEHSLSYAGGLLSLVVAFVAAHGRGNFTFKRILETLVECRFKLVLHEDCGAFNRFGQVIDRLARRDDAEIYQALEAFGIVVPVELRDRVSRAAVAMQVDFLPSWEEVADLVKNLGGEVEIFALAEHTAVLTVANERPGCSLDRSLLPADARAFALDLGSLPGVMARIGGDQQLATIVVAAYNTGVLLSLAGPEHNVVRILADDLADESIAATA